jgi:iron complex transport system substrate-binding protein
MRIVSLLPSTTEILFAIGAGDDEVGVTFECDYPPDALTRPRSDGKRRSSGRTMSSGIGFLQLCPIIRRHSARA